MGARCSYVRPRLGYKQTLLTQSNLSVVTLVTLILVAICLVQGFSISTRLIRQYSYLALLAVDTYTNTQLLIWHPSAI